MIAHLLGFAQSSISLSVVLISFFCYIVVAKSSGSVRLLIVTRSCFDASTVKAWGKIRGRWSKFQTYFAES